MISKLKFKAAGFILCLLLIGKNYIHAQSTETNLQINNKGYYETRGLNVLVFSNWYNDLFDDSKMSGIELIHHGVRTVTNGDVRLNPTPDQWDPIPQFGDRKVDKVAGTIDANLKYPDYSFNYTIRTVAKDGGILISVIIENPLPTALEGRAGFNLEFLPASYFEKSYLIDGKPGYFPLYPDGPMEIDQDGKTDPLPFASGKKMVFAPEDPSRLVTVQALSGELALYDGRNKAQNGWYILRTLIPSGKAGTVVEWFLTASAIENWTRPPVISYSQVGYDPLQRKKAVVEFDRNDTSSGIMSLLRVNEDGGQVNILSSELKEWGNYLRYHYATFDFSEITDPGLYVLKFRDQTTKTFSISPDVYETAWQPALDVYIPVQMDHMLVNEAYRVWHGKSHMDDALQAPVNHKHFDLYGQGPTTDTPYKPGEHIPGLNIGGWYDAGDFDIRTQTHYAVILQLVKAYETFNIQRDETLIDQTRRYVDLHHPDGKPDILQQIEHGTLQLIAQHKSCGHAIPGIIESHLSQYHHLGDAVTNTDNLIYNPALRELESNGFESGLNDDRWAFTSKSTPLNYGSIAALAAASRVLRGFNDSLANECITTASKVWDEEHTHAPDFYRVGNTTGGNLDNEELKAAVELLKTTGEQKYALRVSDLFEKFDNKMAPSITLFVDAMPQMEKSFREKLKEKVTEMVKEWKKWDTENPFGVPITTGGWAGNGMIMGIANTNYILHRAFPDVVSPELTFKGMSYLMGCHPGSNVSFVSSVGTVSKKVAYGMNRANFSFIAGGVVPGMLILPPDFPENKEDWPFLWGENEYVVNMSASYIYLVHAVKDLLAEKK